MPHVQITWVEGRTPGGAGGGPEAHALSVLARRAFSVAGLSGLR